MEITASNENVKHTTLTFVLNSEEEVVVFNDVVEEHLIEAWENGAFKSENEDERHVPQIEKEETDDLNEYSLLYHIDVLDTFTGEDFPVTIQIPAHNTSAVSIL